MKLTDVLVDVGRPVAYYPNIAHMLGSVNAAIFLCQLVYWRGKESNPQAGIYKTSSEIEAETGLSYREQQTARRILRDAGLLTERYARLQHVIYYCVDYDRLDELWSQYTENVVNETSENTKASV